MDKQRMEMILPALKNVSRSRKKSEQNLYLSDLLHVNPIGDTSNSSKIKLPNINNINNFKRNITKFENAKQEQYCRLNRESKIKQNNEWAELLNQRSIETKRPTSPSKANINYYKKLQETNEDIDEATIQLQQISAFIQSKKQQIMDNNTTVSNINLPHIAEKKKKNTSKLKHSCTKNVYPEKINDVKSIMEYVGKEKHQKTNSHKEKYSLQKKKLNDTLGVVNTKLNKIRDKYLNNEYETNNFRTVTSKKPKYKSVKDLMKLDNTRTPVMEASKIIQAELENDINDLLGSNEKFTMRTNNHMEVLYENVGLIQKESFQDNFSDEFRTETSHGSKFSSRTPRQILHEEPKKYFNVSSRTKTPSAKKKDKMKTESITIDTQTGIENNLQHSVMKSDYLMHEFGLDGNNYNMSFNDSKLENEVKIASRKWNKDLEYFMS